MDSTLLYLYRLFSRLLRVSKGASPSRLILFDSKDLSSSGKQTYQKRCFGTARATILRTFISSAFGVERSGPTVKSRRGGPLRRAATAHFGFARKATVAGFHFLSGGMNILGSGRA